jgi:DnaJ family protein C protein 19
MATPLMAGLSVAAAAMAGKYGIEAWQAFKARPAAARMRKFYEGGFQPVMTRREAALILGVRESAAQDKINEAKDNLLGQKRGSGSAF